LGDCYANQINTEINYHNVKNRKKLLTTSFAECIKRTFTKSNYLLLVPDVEVDELLDPLELDEPELPEEDPELVPLLVPTEEFELDPESLPLLGFAFTGVDVLGGGLYSRAGCLEDLSGVPTWLEPLFPPRTASVLG
jgi:hypothetical protein